MKVNNSPLLSAVALCYGVCFCFVVTGCGKNKGTVDYPPADNHQAFELGTRDHPKMWNTEKFYYCIEGHEYYWADRSLVTLYDDTGRPLVCPFTTSKGK
jgi:hypothetical protein